MGQGEKVNAPPAAVFSRPFYLAHRMASLNVGPGRAPEREPWKHGDPLKLPFTPELVPPSIQFPSLDAQFWYYRVARRWLYVFQMRGDQWTWTGEYWIDEAGAYRAIDLKQAAGKEPHQRPKPSKDAAQLLSLPYKINGRQVMYGFFLSGARLPLESIKQLEQETANAGGLWTKLDIYDLDPALYKGAYYQPDKAGNHFLRVKDQLWYTMSLNKMMQQVRDLAIGWVAPAQDMDQQTRQRTEDRARKKLLAETIKTLLDGDPNDKLGLRNEFHPYPVRNYAIGGEEAMRQWLKDYYATVDWWTKTVDEAAKLLIEELDSRVMNFIAESYRLLEKVDPQGYIENLPVFLREHAECMDRVSETRRGGAWIDKVIQNKKHWLQEYVLRQSAPDGVRFQAMRKSITALLAIWSELPTRYVKIYGRTSVKTIVEALDYTTLQSLTRDRARITAYNMILPGTTPIEKASHWEVAPDGWTPTNRRIVKTEIVALEINEVTVHKIENFKRAVEKVFLAIELLNLTMGIQTLIDKGRGGNKSETAWAAIGVIGSSLDAAAAYGALKGWGKATLLKIGGVSAVIDMVAAIREAGQMKDVGDLGAMVGSGFVAGGSGLIAAGYAMSLFGAGTSWSGAGTAAAIVGAVMVALGYIISLFTADSPLELFVAHSVWGRRYGLDSGDKPWSDGSFMNWHESRADGLARQVRAMTHLLANFSIDGMGWGVKVRFGMLHDGTKVHLKFATEVMSERQEVEIVVDLANSQTRVVDRTDPKRLDTGGASTTYGRDHIEVRMGFRDPTQRLPANERRQMDLIREMDCWVRLDYYGNGTMMIPPSGKWVRYRTKALGVAKAENSQNY